MCSIKNLKMGVLVSGQGTNLQALIDAIEDHRLNASIALVISDNPEALALTRARNHKILTRVFLRKDYLQKSDFEREMITALEAAGVEWVVLAGFMRILSACFVGAYPDKILNIHPSLLPAFPGLNAIVQAYQYGVKVTGCTVHLVDEGCDTGPIIAQKTVGVEQEDTLESLTQKIHEQEHQLYPAVLQKIAEGKIQIKGRKIFIHSPYAIFSPSSASGGGGWEEL